MDTKQIAHDLTVALASKLANTPEAIVNAYYDLLPKVKAEVDKAAAQNRKPVKVISKSETGLS